MFELVKVNNTKCNIIFYMNLTLVIIMLIIILNIFFNTSNETFNNINPPN